MVERRVVSNMMCVLQLKLRRIKQDAAVGGISWNSQKEFTSIRQFRKCDDVSKIAPALFHQITNLLQIHINQVLFVTLQITHAASCVAAYAIDTLRIG